MTKQERWQKKQLENGNCRQCGNKSSGKVLCDYCGEKYNKKRREKRAASKQVVDYKDN